MLVPKTARARHSARPSTNVRSLGGDGRHLAKWSERTLVSTISISYGTNNKAANACLGDVCVCVGTAGAGESGCSTLHGDECQPLRCSGAVLTLHGDNSGLLLRVTTTDSAMRACVSLQGITLTQIHCGGPEWPQSSSFMTHPCEHDTPTAWNATYSITNRDSATVRL